LSATAAISPRASPGSFREEDGQSCLGRNWHWFEPFTLFGSAVTLFICARRKMESCAAVLLELMPAMGTLRLDGTPDGAGVLFRRLCIASSFGHNAGKASVAAQDRHEAAIDCVVQR